MIRLWDPRGVERPRGGALAERRRRTEVSRIGLLTNDPSRGQGSLDFRRYQELLADELTRRLGPIEFVRVVKPVLTRPAEDEQLRQLAACHGVVNGLAK